MITAILEPDISGSMSVSWWKQHLRDTKAKCWHTYGQAEAERQQNSMLTEQFQKMNTQWSLS